MRALSLRESSVYPSVRVRFCARAKEIRARAGRFALAHYINLLSRYKNALSTFGSKITPYPLLLSSRHQNVQQTFTTDLQQLSLSLSLSLTRTQLDIHDQGSSAILLYVYVQCVCTLSTDVQLACLGPHFLLVLILFKINI